MVGGIANVLEDRLCSSEGIRRDPRSDRVFRNQGEYLDELMRQSLEWNHNDG
jgi:hypothetical protein